MFDPVIVYTIKHTSRLVVVFTALKVRKKKDDDVIASTYQESSSNPYTILLAHTRKSPYALLDFSITLHGDHFLAVGTMPAVIFPSKR